MAEPIAAGVLNTLFQPRIQQLSSLSRVARTASQSALKSSTFFTPAPLPVKQNDRTFASSVTEHHILGCQAWACPPSKQELWGQDGSMRTALMTELTPEHTRVGRARKTSNSNRNRITKTFGGESSRRYHKSATEPFRSADGSIQRDLPPHNIGEHSFPANEPSEDAESYYDDDASEAELFQENAEKDGVDNDYLDRKRNHKPPRASRYKLIKRRRIYKTHRGNRMTAQYKQLFNNHTFLQLKENGYLQGKDPEDLLNMAKFLCDATDTLCDPEKHVLLEQRAENILYLMELVKTNASTSSAVLDQEQIDAAIARALAFKGEFVEALSFLRQYVEEHGPSDARVQSQINMSLFHQVNTTVILAVSAYRSREDALLFIYESLQPQWTLREEGFKLSIDRILSQLHLFRDIDLVALKEAQGDWDAAKHADFFNFLHSALNSLGRFTEAYRLVMQRRDMQESCDLALVVESMLALLARGQKRKALELFRTLPPDMPDYASHQKLFDPNLGIHRSFARNMINVARSEFKKIGLMPKTETRSAYIQLLRDPPVVEQEQEEELVDEPSTSLAVDDSLLQKYPGRYATAMEAFEGEHPKGPDGIRNPKPFTSAYLSVAVALRTQRDNVGIIKLWEDMQEQSVIPGIDFLTIILASYRSLFDTRGVFSLFSYMKEHGMQGDCLFYTGLMRYFATRMDLKAVEESYEYAVSQGLEPDHLMRMALLSAYMKCGQWQKGIAMFTEMRKAGDKVNTRMYNTILEGCVYMGAPFKTVLRLFARLEMEGVIPNKFTYSILMHHAMIGGHWTFARSLYHDLLSMDLKLSNNVEVNKRFVDLPLLTIMIRGYLRVQKHPEAKAMVAEMKRLGMEYTAIIHTSIARAYIASGSEEDVELAEEYITDVVADPNGSWRTNQTKRMRKDPLAMMYAPLLAARAKLKDLEGVERVMGAFLNAGGVPTISILRHMLVAYGDAGQIDNFRLVWSQIMALALDSRAEAQLDAEHRITSSMRSITAPLDIYTRTMSRHGHHEELTRTWATLVDAEADFDEQNWISYIYACLRAGQIERAFEIVERIVQPNFNYGLRNHFRVKLLPDLPYETKLGEIEILRGGPAARPFMTEVQRKVAQSKNRTTNRRVEFIDAQAMVHDFAYPLRALRKLGPAWTAWQPPTAVLEAMLMAVLYLEDGLPLRPLKPGEETPFDIAVEELEDRSVTEPLIDFLLGKHPRTFHRLRRFRFKERAVLGTRGFRDKYIWSRKLK